MIALLLAGETIALTAKRSGVSLRTVSMIKASPDFAQLHTLKRESEPTLHELVTQHLISSLEVVNSICHTIKSDPAWVLNQRAEQLAIFYGTVSGKIVRLYDAKLRADQLALEQKRLETSTS